MGERTKESDDDDDDQDDDEEEEEGEGKGEGEGEGEIIGHWSLVSAFHEHKKHIFFSLGPFLILALKQSESLCVYLTKNPSLRLGE